MIVYQKRVDGPWLFVEGIMLPAPRVVVALMGTNDSSGFQHLSKGLSLSDAVELRNGLTGWLDSLSEVHEVKP